MEKLSLLLNFVLQVHLGSQKYIPPSKQQQQQQLGPLLDSIAAGKKKSKGKLSSSDTREEIPGEKRSEGGRSRRRLRRSWVLKQKKGAENRKEELCCGRRLRVGYGTVGYGEAATHALTCVRLERPRKMMIGTNLIPHLAKWGEGRQLSPPSLFEKVRVSRPPSFQISWPLHSPRVSSSSDDDDPPPPSPRCPHFRRRRRKYNSP